jgi:deoxyribodipyrimidine photolyase-like uncharacterized protein
VAELRALVPVLVLRDQHDRDVAALDGVDAGLDAVWMAEASDKSTQLGSGKPRTALFQGAMRRFALALRAPTQPRSP